MTSRIRRSRESANFTQIANGVLRDNRLSWRARGLLGHLLSLPANWETSVDKLVEEAREQGSGHAEGRDAMRGAAKELEQYGYLVRTRIQGERGLWHTELVVYGTPHQDAPTTENPASDTAQPTTENPSSVPPAQTVQTPRSLRRLENRPSVNQSSKEIRSTNTEQTQTPPPQPAAPSTGVSDEGTAQDKRVTFDDFWAVFPRKLDKGHARKAWAVATRKGDPCLIVATLRTQVETWRKAGTEARFIPYPATWLNGERWADAPSLGDVAGRVLAYATPVPDRYCGTCTAQRYLETPLGRVPCPDCNPAAVTAAGGAR